MIWRIVDMTTFELIKKLAKERGYTLTKLNDKAGLGTNSIYHWKTKTPSTDGLTKVASVLNVSVDYLLGKTDDPTASNKKEPTQIDMQDAVDSKDVIMTFEGKPIPQEDLEIMLRFLRGGKSNE